MTDHPVNSKAQLQEMLDSGKITEEEYAELLDALESSESPVQAAKNNERNSDCSNTSFDPKYSKLIVFCIVFGFFLFFLIPFFIVIKDMAGSRNNTDENLFIGFKAMFSSGYGLIFSVLFILMMLLIFMIRQYVHNSTARLILTASSVCILFFFLSMVLLLSAM